ncbi:MAG: hypothetical protein NXI22_22015 [bacterium]|nr:hypothetical protein [bacterium]
MQRETTDSGGTIYGRLVIVFIFGTALALAVFAWIFRYYQGREALDYWGPQNAEVFVHATELEFDKLPAEKSDPKISKDAHDIADLRSLFLRDESFVFEKKRPREDVAWEYSLEFRGDKQPILVLFSASEGMVARADADQAVAVIDSFSAGIENLLKKQWEEEQAEPGKTPAEANAP